MITLLKDWKGKVEIDGKRYDNIEDAKNDFKTFSDSVHIKLHSNVEKRSSSQIEASDDTLKEYQITVKAYMTKKATPEFDFMARWNNDTPMPLRTMTGTIEKETRGMVYMNLHGLAKPTITCMCCGKELTNPVSRKYGIGPICLSKIGIARDIDDVAGIIEELVNTKWSGWVIKSSLLECEEV